MTTRQILTGCLAAATTVLAACSEIAGPSGIVGSWAAVSLDGENLPIVEASETDNGRQCTDELTALTLTFEGGGTGEVEHRGRSNCETTAFQSYEDSYPFTYTFSGNSLTLDFGDDDREVLQVAISGSRLTLTSEDGEVSVFRRQ